MVKSKILSNVPEIVYDFLLEKEWKNKNVSRIGIPDITIMEQIHGSTVLYTTGSINPVKSCDGLVTDKKIVLGIKTADCLPILFVDINKKIIGIIHAGWKGLSNGILEKAILQLSNLGGNLKSIVSVVGPHICSCCYDVDEYRVELFYKKFGKKCVIRTVNGKLYLDLAETARKSLLALGLESTNIEVINVCTFCNKLFPSYRRDGLKAGRMLTFIGLKE